MKKSTLAIFLSFVMIILMLPTAAYASEFSDMPNDWSTTALENAVNNGLLSGYNGKIMTKDYLTRAQMATIVNRAFGTTEKASLSSYTDVAANAWYYDDMAKAVQMKTFVGSGDKLNPDSNITREEAFVVLASALKLSGASVSALDKFHDKALVSQWAKDGVASLVSAGYVAGSNGQLNAKQYITRAELAQMMDNLLKKYIKTSGTYSTDITGKVMINVPNVTLKSIKITGDLIIGDGVGNGDVTLDSVVVTGRTVIRGGGVNSIKIIGNSNLQNIVIARVDGQVRVYSADGTQIGDVIVDGSDDVIIEGDVGSLTITAPGVTVTATNANIVSAAIEGENSIIIVGAKSTIKTVTAEAKNATITASAGSKIENIVVNSDGAKINGTGDVGTVAANAKNISVTTPGTSVAAATGTTGVTAGTTTVTAGTTTVTTGSTGTVTSGNTSSGGGGSSTSTVAVSAINVTGADTVVNGQTLQMSATVSPSNATYQTIAWTVASGTGTATISAGGLLTATALGTVTVIATNAASGVTVTKVITVNAAVLGIIVEAQNFNTNKGLDYYGATVGYKLSGTDAVAAKVASVKVALYDAANNKLVENTTKSPEKATANPNNNFQYSSAFIVKAGTYNISGTWNFGTWTPTSIAKPAKAIITVTDINGFTYTAQNTSFQASAPSEPTWESLFVVGEAITGLDVPANVLQLGRTITTATAITTEAGAGAWTSSNQAVATVGGSTGVVTALTAGTTTIAYTTSTSNNFNSKAITVYAAAANDDPTIGVVQVGAAAVTPTSYTGASYGQTLTWISTIEAKARVNVSTGLITAVTAGDTWIAYAVSETATGRIVVHGSVKITVIESPAVVAALAAVNAATAESNYAAMQTAIQGNAATLGLSLTTYDTLITERKPAVSNDLFQSKPAGGYTKDTLKLAFDEIVATRVVFQNSMNLVNAASETAPLKDVSFVTMLTENLGNVKNYTKHSGIAIADKITTLNALVTRYTALSDAKRTAALLAVSSADYLSSTQTLDALGAALTTQEKVAVGDSYGGGKVAYILVSSDTGYDANVQHGLIAATTDQSAATTVWSNIYTALDGTEKAYGTGQANTTAIVGQSGCNSGAAYLCDKLEEGGHTDWFLPSPYELNKLYLNRVAIGGFFADYSVYWGSYTFLQFPDNNSSSLAWMQEFTDGAMFGASKATINRVRAVRTF